MRLAPGLGVAVLTAAGREALDVWLLAPGFPEDRRKQGFLVKLFFADRMGAARAADVLAEVRAASEAKLTELRAVVARLEGLPGRAAAARLTALHGVRMAEARLAWLDEAAAALPLIVGEKPDRT